MSSQEDSMEFHFNWELAREDIRKLRRRASELGILEEFEATLFHIEKKLTRDPLGWGEPKWKTKAAGGIYCCKIHQLLVIRYVVFPDHKKGMVQQVFPLQHHPLYQDESQD